MKKKDKEIEILHPKNQLKLFGYKDYFKTFVDLYNKNKLPNSILLSGSKGLGKATFIYHFINYLLSINEENSYSINDYIINENNLSYKLLNSNSHPNFFLVDNLDNDKQIKIEQIKNLLKFINKTTLAKDLKLILIDNAENLNLNSSNALLKTLEEPNFNTFFFIIHNQNKILDTIKSRTVEFKISFSSENKKNIFKKISLPYGKNVSSDFYDNISDTPGNIIKILLKLKKEFNNNSIDDILILIDIYEKDKNPELLNFISLYIEKFYNDLCMNSGENFNSYYFNFNKILKRINEMKKYNLSEKNTLVYVRNILKNETK